MAGRGARCDCESSNAALRCIISDGPQISWSIINSTGGNALVSGETGVVTTCSSECVDRFVHLADSYGDVSTLTVSDRQLVAGIPVAR